MKRQLRFQSVNTNYPLSFLKNVYNFPFINYSRLRLSTVLFFAIIVFDEARPKILCSHTKLIIVCSFCCGRQTVKLFYFARSGKQSNIQFGPCWEAPPYILVIGNVLAVVIIGLVAELWPAKRTCGAQWVSKSTRPRKFGNHVTVHRPPAARPSASQGNQCSIPHFLASLRAQEDSYCSWVGST